MLPKARMLNFVPRTVFTMLVPNTMRLSLAALFCSVFFLASISAAQQQSESAPKTMTKLIVRLSSPEIPEGSFAAAPRTLYRAGTRYCRIEEAPDPGQGIHGLIVINEPDIWMVNLYAKNARHMVDPGPTFNCRLPIFVDVDSTQAAEDLKKPLMDLEFGREIAFFRAKNADTAEGPVLREQRTQAYSVTIGETLLYLFTAGVPEKPIAVVRQTGDLRQTIWYGLFEEIPFQASLFAKPEGMEIEEVP